MHQLSKQVEESAHLHPATSRHQISQIVEKLQIEYDLTITSQASELNAVFDLDYNEDNVQSQKNCSNGFSQFEEINAL